MTTKALVFAGAATLPEGNDERATAWDLTGADGGRRATEEELRRLAAFLEDRTVPERSLAALREHVRSTRLADSLDADDLRGRAEKARDLSDIARDL